MFTFLVIYTINTAHFSAVICPPPPRIEVPTQLGCPVTMTIDTSFVSVRIGDIIFAPVALAPHLQQNTPWVEQVCFYCMIDCMWFSRY